MKFKTDNIAMPISRKHQLSIFKILIAIVLLFLLTHTAQIKMELLATLIRQPLSFLSIILFFFMITLIGAWRWYVLNCAQVIPLGFYKSIIATYVGAAFNNLLPSGVGGDVVRLFYVFKIAPQKKSDALLALFSDRGFGFLAVFVTICVVGLVHARAVNNDPHIFYLFLVCSIFCLCVLSGFILCVWLTHRFQFSAWVEKYIGHRKWAAPIISFLKTLGLFRISISVFIKCLAISILNQTMLTITIMSIVAMMGLPLLSFTDFLIAMGITQIVNLIPLTPGGIGVGEMAFANILLVLNPGASGAYATAFFAYRLISMLAYLPGLIVFIPKFTGIAMETRQK
jgi:uncharacterized protein (TIRG00374 family)